MRQRLQLAIVLGGLLAGIGMSLVVPMPSVAGGFGPPAGAGGGAIKGGYFGDGYDGPLTVTGGSSFVMSRDMYFTNLTIAGTGFIAPSGYRLFVSGTLDLTQATQAGALRPAQILNGTTGMTGPNNNSTGGSGPQVFPSTLCMASSGAGGGQGAAGNTPAAGSPPVQVMATLSLWAASGGFGGPGGAGSTGQLGGTGGATSITSTTMVHRLADFPIARTTNTTAGGNILTYGCSASGSGGGGGAGTSGGSLTVCNGIQLTGGAGGGGALGAQMLYLAANTIAVGPSTATDAISFVGGMGGAGGNGTPSPSGSCSSAGGGGGGGGQGGLIYVLYSNAVGSSSELFNASGGTGGNGGNAGGAQSQCGYGGNGGAAGDIVLINLTSGAVKTPNMSLAAGSHGMPGTTGATGGCAGGTGGRAVLRFP